MSAELLPCPFCFSTNLLVEHLEGTVLHPAYRVLCGHCGASTGYTDKDFRANWNRRAPAPEQPAAQVNRLPGAVQNSEFCNGCGAPLLLGNLLVDDGCPCNTPRGVNITPQPCSLCRTDNCVKPAHAALGGSGQVVDEALYRSACDSVEEWKARALEAEQALERIRLDESPTFMGEPVLFELGDGASLLLRYGRHDESCATRHDSALKGRPACDCGFSAAIAAIAALQRQPADADREDAERYRFLAGSDVPAHSTRWSRWRLEYFAGFHGGWGPLVGTDLDAAIDSARAEGGGRER